MLCCPNGPLTRLIWISEDKKSTKSLLSYYIYCEEHHHLSHVLLLRFLASMYFAMHAMCKTKRLLRKKNLILFHFLLSSSILALFLHKGQKSSKSNIMSSKKPTKKIFCPKPNEMVHNCPPIKKLIIYVFSITSTLFLDLCNMFSCT